MLLSLALLFVWSWIVAINYKIAFVRWWAARLSDITLYLGYVMVVFREDQRALHDLLAGTQVLFKK